MKNSMNPNKVNLHTLIRNVVIVWTCMNVCVCVCLCDGKREAVLLIRSLYTSSFGSCLCPTVILSFIPIPSPPILSFSHSLILSLLHFIAIPCCVSSSHHYPLQPFFYINPAPQINFDCQKQSPPFKKTQFTIQIPQVYQ